MYVRAINYMFGRYRFNIIYYTILLYELYLPVTSMDRLLLPSPLSATQE